MPGPLTPRHKCTVYGDDDTLGLSCFLPPLAHDTPQAMRAATAAPVPLSHPTNQVVASEAVTEPALAARTARLRLEVRAAEEALLRREAAEAERVAQLEDELAAARRLSDEQGCELEAERSKVCASYVGLQPGTAWGCSRTPALPLGGGISSDAARAAGEPPAAAAQVGALA